MRWRRGDNGKEFQAVLNFTKEDFAKQALEIEDLEISTFLIGNSMTQVAGDSQRETMKRARNNVILKLHNGFK